MSSHFYFLKNDDTLATPPALYLASGPVDPDRPGEVIVDLPNLFAKEVGEVSQGPFHYHPRGLFTKERITVDNTAGGAWDFSGCTAATPPFRPALAADYLAFLLQLDPLLVPTAGGRSASFELLRQLVAGAVPLTPAEALFYRYGFMPAGVDLATGAGAASWVDLVPGMRLRIEPGSYQTINPSTATALNGFVPAGTVYAEVGTLGLSLGRLALNPFLTQAVGGVAPNAVLAATSAVASVADVAVPFAYPCWRLCYPALPLVSAGSQGYAGTQQNATLIGAPDRATLETQTQAYAANGVVATGTALYFNGRTLVTPEIAVFVAGQRVWVPLGTTLRNLLETIAPVPYFSTVGIAVDPPSPLLSRVVPPSSKWAGPEWAAVQTGKGSGGYQGYPAYGADSFDLPLLSGDVVSLALPS